MPREPAPPLEQTSQAKATTLLLLRVLYPVLAVVVTALFLLKISQDEGKGPTSFLRALGWSIAVPFVVSLSLVGVVLATDILTPRKKLSTLSGVFLGLLAGLLASVAISFLIDLAAQGYELEKSAVIPTLKILLSLSLCYLAVSVVLQTQDDFRLVVPYVEFAKQIRGARPLLLDTSVLIDGRILDIAHSGLIQAPIIVPRFVVAELNALADSSDKLKRARGRRGLDLVSKLQRSTRLDVSISEAQPGGKGADQMLVELARIDDAIIVTTDSGLTRVAEIHDVRVINLHALASTLRPGVVSGERLAVRIVKPGEQPSQGVGYLDDGTMVVVENGGDLIGQERSLVVTGSLQTTAGRLIFARVVDDAATLAEGGGNVAGSPALASPGASTHAADAPPPGPDADAAGASPGSESPGDAPTRGRPDIRRAAFRNPRRG